MRKTITNKLVDALKPAPRRYEVRDTALPGFGLRVAPTGRKTWVVTGRVHGRQTRHCLGTYPVISLSKAREAARSIVQDMQLGEYAEAALETAKPPTLNEVIADFIEIYAKPKNRGWKPVQATLRKFAPLGHRPIAEISRSDIVRVLDGIVAAGAPIGANHAMAAIKKVFAWAVDRGVITVHPVIGMKAPAKPRSRDRVLTDDELRGLWTATDGMGFPFGPMYRLLLLTGQRRGEVAGMRWSQVELARAVWTIPAAMAKNGRAHEVPLAPSALATLHALPRFTGSDFVFTTTGRTPVSGFGRTKNRLDALMGTSDWWVHDLRRTAASGMARIGVAPHVIEKVLNHVSGQISGVAAVYNRHGYHVEKRDALERWQTEVSRITANKADVRAHVPRAHWAVSSSATDRADQAA